MVLPLAPGLITASVSVGFFTKEIRYYVAYLYVPAALLPAGNFDKNLYCHERSQPLDELPALARIWTRHFHAAIKCGRSDNAHC